MPQLVRKCALLASASALFVCWTSTATAQTSANESPALALDRFYAAPAGDRMFGAESPYVAGRLTPHVMLLVDYAHNPLVLRTEKTGKDLGAVVENQLLLHANASLALWNRVNLNLDVPVALFQSGADPSGAGFAFTSPSSVDLSDLRAGLRLRLFGDYHDPFQLALSGYVWFPTGPSANGSFVGEGSVRGLPQIVAGGRTDRLVWSLNVGADLREQRTFAGVTNGSAMRFGGGLGFLLGDDRALQIGPEFTASVVLDNPNSTPIERATNAEVLADARYRFLGDFEAGVGVGPGLTSGIGTPDLRVVAMIAYTPTVQKAAAPTDTDGDAILDEKDACPTVRGVADPDPRKHGCPPEAKAPRDTDGDTIADDEDACPTTRGVSDTEPKKNGCPPDTDGDGIADAADACPTVKGVPDAAPTKNGCPPDKDGDGIADAVDACAEIKGVATRDPATHGCPGDTDGDGIRDDVDACPNEKGSANPDPGKNGCPTSVRVSETEIYILRQVEFDTSKATIRKVSDSLLDEVAQVLKEHPEITRVEVQGHTDSRGSASLNKTLSQSRAESVKGALERRGIAADRLTPRGYGPDKPVGDNATDTGRQKNRRVQFVIVERGKKQ